MITGLVFYMFAFFLLLSGLLVISVRNPVHAVLCLILGFFNAAGLCVLLGAEFIAMMLVIIYVGAVAVLFLFVVMMLDINYEGLRAGVVKYLPIGGAVGFLLLFELISLFAAWEFTPGVEGIIGQPTPDATEVSNIHALGQLLYTDYVYLFQASGIILLIAMIGAIVLSHRTREGVRRQDIEKQVSTKREDVISVKKINSGTGIS